MRVARTDADAAKHKGLTYFLLDMEQDEVQVRPLRQITGEAEFNELFLEEASIPDDNVIGGVGNGWKVALTTLMNERAGLAFFLQVRLRQLLDDLLDEAAGNGALDDPLTADEPWAYELLRSRGNSIEGGTTEILKNIVAERVLNLPRAR